MAKYTPGPLRAVQCRVGRGDEPNDHAIVDADGFVIGEAYHVVESGMTRPAEANARLWAAAADLLEALEGCVLRLEMDDAPCADATLELAHAAIAKAQGREVVP